MKKRFVFLMMFILLMTISVIALAQTATVPLPTVFGIDPTAITLILGGIASLLTAVFNRSSYSTNAKYAITYGASAAVALIAGVATKNLTGANLTVQGLIVGFFIIAGVANVVYAFLRFKLNLVRDGFNGGDIVLPTSQSEFITDAESALKYALSEYGLPALLGKVADLARGKIKPAATSQAGIAGAVPSPDSAPLVGGSTIIPQVLNPVGVAAHEQVAMGNLHATTGQSFTPADADIPAASDVVHITPSPETQAKIDAVTSAITTGENAEMAVTDGYNPQAD